MNEKIQSLAYMSYPIDANEYIAAIQDFATEQCKQFCCEYVIPMVNKAYQDGKEGCGDYPIKVAETLSWIEQKRGRPISEWTRQTFTLLIDWCNNAYIQGLQKAEVQA